MNGIAASEKLFKILDYEITEQPSGKLDNAPISIQLKHVNFSYDENRQILKDINMEDVYKRQVIPRLPLIM